MKKINVRLDTEIEEAEFSELKKRAAELIFLYNSQDPNRYVAFFSKEGGIPDPDRVASLRQWLKEHKLT